MGVGLLRRGKQFAHRPLLHLFPLTHDQYPIGYLRHYAHIVGNKNHPHLHFLLQYADKLQDLRLNGDVQRCGRFIGNQ
ncbi:hypothetical protein D3C72_1306580 [compost metagenome]